MSLLRAADLDRAATMAYRVLIAQRVTALPVDPLFLLRQCRETVVWTYTEAAESLEMTGAAFERRFGTADAFTIRQGDRFITCYREGGNPARLRFTLAHELGHRVLGHHGGAADEREADVFASHLLCPRPVLARLTGRGVSLTAERIARLCYVSRSCARTLTADSCTTVPPTVVSEMERLWAPEIKRLAQGMCQKSERLRE